MWVAADSLWTLYKSWPQPAAQEDIYWGERNTSTPWLSACDGRYVANNCYGCVYGTGGINLRELSLPASVAAGDAFFMSLF